MAGRYLVTGVQLAMLATLPSQPERLKLVDEIIDKQFVANSDLPVEDDASWMMNLGIVKNLFRKGKQK